MKTIPQKDITIRLSDKEEFFAVDFFRLVFALGVVAIHLPPLVDVNEPCNYFLVHIFSRLSNPYFFLVSGFFLQKKMDDFKKIRAYAGRLAQLYVLYTLLYLPQIIYEYIIEGKSPLHMLLAFLRNFILTGSYTHLWYFVGSIVAALLLYLLVKKLGMHDRKIAVIVLGLYAIGTLLDAYCYPFRESLDISVGELLASKPYALALWLYFKIFTTTRNGLFFGLPYMFFGYLIAKNRHRIVRKNYFLLSAFFFAVMLGEKYLVVTVFHSPGTDMLFSLLPTSILVFLAVLFLDCGQTRENAQLAKHFRYLSVLYYGLHLFLNFYVEAVLKGIWGIELHSMSHFVLIVAVNFLVAEAIIHLSSIPQFKWLRKFY